MIAERLSPQRSDSLDGILDPSENPFLLGRETAAAILSGAYKAGKLPHAMLLAGPKGIGKATLAYHLAHHLLKYPDAASAPEMLATPDPASSLFRQIALGAHPAILHLARPFDEKSKKFKTVLSVDEVRRVNRFLSMTSHDGSYRVVIVDPADDLNRNAANALLKNLEEPPSRTIFLLIAHSPGSLLPTIRSRCQTIRLSALSDTESTEIVARLGVVLPEDRERRDAILTRAGGSVRNAILLSAFGGLEIVGMVDRVADTTQLDLSTAHRLAEAVGGRDQEIRFDLMNGRAMECIANAANEAARNGQSLRAGRLSAAWEKMRIAIDDTETYNLDRKQHALTVMVHLHESLRL